MSSNPLKSRYEAGWRASGLGLHLADVVRHRDKLGYVFGVNVETRMVQFQWADGPGGEDEPTYNVPVDELEHVHVRAERG